MNAEKNVTSQNQLLTEKDLADRWQVTRERLRGWRMNGIGPAYVKIGAAVRYRMEEVEAYELENLKGGDAA